MASLNICAFDMCPGFLIFEIYRDDDCEKFSALIGKGS